MKKIDIKLGRGRAFGSGGHETTRSCLNIIESIDLQGKTVLDFGCGTGILSLACALKGASKVIAVDNEPEAVLNTMENIRLNSFDSVIFPVLGDISTVSGIRYDVIIANLYWDILMHYCQEILHSTMKGGLILLSGIEIGRDFDIKSRFIPYCEISCIEYLEEFATILLRRNSP
ncbi:50S ribosomal protein L11 methyltransferase [bacterium]|nr:50S ribosomal protein L11 methyltransferase [bacterium]